MEPNENPPNQIHPPFNSSSLITDEYRKLHIRPWIRFWARYVDLCILGISLSFFIALFFPSFSLNTITASILVVSLWLLIEPLILFIFGTTLGKFLLSIKICDLNGDKPNFYTFLKEALGCVALDIVLVFH